jgi:exosortase F-associated protein
VNRESTIRWMIGVFSAAGLIAVFVLQKTNVADILANDYGYMGQFIINRLIRFLLNDLFAIGLIYALFFERKYVLFALWVQLAGVILFLIPYFILRINFPFYNGPLINYLHRLILNPTLLLLLIPAFYYQKQITRI